MAKHNEIGRLGENLAVKYLKYKGYKIIGRNFNVKLGEIDIIASQKGFNFHVKRGDLVFVEVKTKSLLDFKDIEFKSHFNPENNLTFSKRQKILKAIRHYLAFHRIEESDIEIKIMGIMVFLNNFTKQAKFKVYEDILF